MTTVSEWTIDGAEGQPILGNAHVPETPVGVLVCCHGFKGYKDYGFFPRLAEAAADAGLVAHRFNFSHSGMTNRLDTFERPDLFERDTWGKQIADIGLVLDAIDKGELAGTGLPVVLFGHSRGGLSAILAADRLGSDRLAGLVSASAPHEPCSLSEDAKTTLRADGRLLSPSSRTGQDLYVGKAWLDEIESDPAAFDPVKAAGRISIPHLIIHGEEDPTVPVAAALAIKDAPGTNKELQIIPGAQHTFNCPNPLPSGQPLPKEAQAMVDATCAFARSCCKPSA